MSAPCFRLDELATRFGLRLQGNPAVSISSVGTLRNAAETALSFLANPQYRRELPQTRAAAVVLREADAPNCPRPCLISPNPYADYARIAALFDRSVIVRPGIHASAVVDPSARIDESAEVGALCVIGPGCVVGAGALIGPGCILGEHCSVGPGSRLVARVTLVLRVQLGARVVVHPGVVIGADGFGAAFADGAWIRVPQLGGVRIGDDCDIGANTTIDRGAIEDTVLEEDVRLDNQIQIGHNVVIGAHTAIAGCTAVAGSSKIGRNCLIAGGVGIAGHLEIGDRVSLTAMTLVSRSLPGPGEYSSGTPIQTTREWRKSAARFRQLDELARKLKHTAKDIPE